MGIPTETLSWLVVVTVMHMFLLVMSVLWVLTMLLAFYRHPLKWSKLSNTARANLMWMIGALLSRCLCMPLCAVAVVCCG